MQIAVILEDQQNTDTEVLSYERHSKSFVIPEGYMTSDEFRKQVKQGLKDVALVNKILNNHLTV